jgi:hypothetical protein
LLVFKDGTVMKKQKQRKGKLHKTRTHACQRMYPRETRYSWLACDPGVPLFFTASTHTHPSMTACSDLTHT